ncbi:MAG: hypothetical protein ACO1SX_03270 [Actinomycetota bacterium]
MFKIRGIVLCALLALIAGDAQAARVAKVEGAITAIDAVSTPPTVTIARASGDVTLKVLASTKIRVDNERGTLLDLTVGAQAEAQYELSSGVAKKIEIEDTEEDATVFGDVLSADPISGVITLDTTGDGVLDLTLTADAQTRIEVAGATLTLAELDALEGQRVKVEYLTDTFVVTEIETGDAAALSARGTVTEIDPIGGALTIETAAGPLTFDVAEGAVIRIGGQVVELGDVLVGDSVQVIYLAGDANLAIRLSVQPPRPKHITGTIAAVDAGAGTLTVTRGAAAVVLTVGPNTDLRVNGRGSTLADVEAALTAGRTAKVSASYFVRGEINLATDVRVNVKSRGRR